jgi:VWFA-related protein
MRTTTLTTLAALAVLAVLHTTLAAPSLSAQTAGPSPFGEKVEVNIVNVEVFVSDGDGRPVDGLRRGDFELREDGKAVVITNFEAFRQAAPATVPGAPAPAAKPAAQDAAAPAPDPLHLVIYVDNGFLLPAHRNRVLQQLRDFLGQLRPEDEVMLVTADPDLRIRVSFTRDRAALARALDEIGKLTSLGLANAAAKRQALTQIFEIRDLNSHKLIDSPCNNEIAQPARFYAEATRAEVLRSLGAMRALVSSLSGISGRKALLLVSDGMPLTPGEEIFQVLGEICGSRTSGSPEARISGNGFDLGPLYDDRQAALDAQGYSAADSFQAFTAHANAQRVTLYTLQASGLQGSASAAADIGLNERIAQLPSVAAVETENLQSSLTLLAGDTGGRAILNANDLRSALARMQEDFATYYSLAYAPPHSGDGREHRIEVRVKRPGLRVRSRRSYRDKPSLERMADRALASLFYGIEDNPLQIEMTVGDSAPVDKATWMVPIRLRIPLFKVTMLTTETSFEGKLRVLVATGDAAGKRSPLRQVQVPISIPRYKALVALGQYYVYEVKLTLEPGEQHIAVVVRDEPTATASFLARTLQVGAVSPAL